MLNKISLRMKLTVLTGILLVVAVTIGVLNMLSLNDARRALQTVYQDRTVCIAQLRKVESLVNYNMLLYYASAISRSAAATAKNLTAAEKNTELNGKTWDKYYASYMTA